MPSKTILTVTLNPAIDRITEIPSFKPGTHNRAMKVVSTAGGKGINVSRALHKLGAKSITAGFAGGANGQTLLRDLLLEGFEHHFVFTQGETRVNLTVKDQKTGKVTRLIEPGPTIDAKDLASFREKFKRLAGQSEWVVLSGRGIGGTPPDFYRELVVTGQKEGAKVIVDTSGEDLVAALKGKPFLVKPNLEEAEAVLEQKLSTRVALKKALKRFLNAGARNVIISLGEKGAVGSDDAMCYLAIAPKIKAVNTVGCGDSLTAGFVNAAAQNKSFPEALAFAVAAGTASCLKTVPGDLDLAKTKKIFKQIVVKAF